MWSFKSYLESRTSSVNVNKELGFQGHISSICKQHAVINRDAVDDWCQIFMLKLIEVNVNRQFNCK